MSHPSLISVVLPVYNCELYIREAVESILAQTYTAFELIVVNDGSTDGTAAILAGISDPRLRVMAQPNGGIVKALNAGLQAAKGQFIARQDADDISLPERFARQMAYLQANPEVMVCGTWAEVIDVQNRVIGLHNHPAGSNAIKFHTIFDTFFVHSTVLFRRELIDTIGLYSDDTSIFEDFNYWSRVTRRYPTANLPEVLLRYRELHTGISKNTANFNDRVRNQRRANLLYYAPELQQQPRILELLTNWAMGLQKASQAELRQLKRILLEINARHCRDAAENKAFITLFLQKYTRFELGANGRVPKHLRSIDRFLTLFL